MNILNGLTDFKINMNKTKTALAFTAGAALIYIAEQTVSHNFFLIHFYFLNRYNYKQF